MRERSSVVLRDTYFEEDDEWGREYSIVEEKSKYSGNPFFLEVIEDS